MHVVLDTNILVSGLLWGGPPRQILVAARTQKLTLSTSQALLDELHIVFQRRKFMMRFQIVGMTANEMIIEYAALARIVTPAPLPAPVCDDPDDDAVIACAVAASADVIVSGDDDLLRLGSYSTIQIITAAELLQRLAAIAQQ